MENWYTERENKTECFPDELYEKFGKADRLSHTKALKKKARQCSWLRKRNYKFRRIGKLYRFHYVLHDGRDDVNTVIFSYSLPNYYIPDFDKKSTRVKRITREHNYAFQSGDLRKKYKKQPHSSAQQHL